jgi:Arm DNA-binding domain
MTSGVLPKSRIRTINRLSASKVVRLKETGLDEDGAGLRLVITDKHVERGLGVWPVVSLETARSEASELRSAAKSGEDLHATRNAERSKQRVTFGDAFHAFFAVRRRSSIKHGT